MYMTELPTSRAGQHGWTKTRAAALGFGLGTTLALSPFVWAQSPPPTGAAAPLSAGPATAVPQQSLAPLVKRVLPAVVNISVTEKAGAGEASAQVPEGGRGTPFDDFMRRFFEDRRSEGGPRAFRGMPE